MSSKAPAGGFGLYCIDTSSLVDLWRWRPPKQHKKVWAQIDDLIDQKRLVAPKMVLEELARQDDDLLRWARERKRGLFRRTTQGLVTLAHRIINDFPRLVDPDQPFDSADPFIVALATLEAKSRALFSKEVVVITEEKYAPGSHRIPEVCASYGLKYLTVHQMFLFERWTF